MNEIETPQTGFTAWVVATVFGVVAAVCHRMVPEQGLTLLWVMFSTMVLGCWKLHRPWRWTLLVGLFVPAEAVLHKISYPAQVARAAIYGSFLALLPALIGAYGGHFMRRMVQNVWPQKS